MVSSSRREAVSKDFDAVKDDLRKIKTDAGAVAKSAYDAGCCSAAEAAESLKSGLRSTRIRGRLGLRLAREQVETRPGTAVAAAFGLGLVMGLFLLGRRA